MTTERETADPGVAYGQRLSTLGGEALALERRDRQIASARLLVFAAAVGLAVAACSYELVAPLWLAAPGAVFVALMVLHELTLRRLARARLAIAHYERGLARVEDRWAELAAPWAGTPEAEHPFAADLDLLGPGSLMALLCTARTRVGEHCLTRWIVGPPPSVAELRARQLAVAELGPRLALREDLALLADGVRGAVSPEVLVGWAAAPPGFAGRERALTAAASALTAGVLVAASGWWLGLCGPLPLVVAVAASLLLLKLLGERLTRSVAAVERPERELAVLAGLLRRVASESFESSVCRGVQQRSAGGELAIARLGRLVGWLDAQRNPLFAPVALALLWPLHLSLAIERWRARHGDKVAGWLDAVGELEALCSLASYTFEHPDDPFPELVGEGPLFDAVELGHPLLPRVSCVRNDLRLGGDSSVLIVSGSNMSGKSTLLRAVGINAVLAFAGGPVRAAALRISPLAIGATIRIEDSLQAGRSRFFAEVRRLRLLFDLASAEPQVPLLFLVDELLHGTNSADRRVGAAALLDGLRQLGAVGLVTTHDLAIAEAVDELGDGVRNVHFADDLEGDRLVFNYRLREGKVARGNGLALMRSVGLPV